MHVSPYSLVFLVFLGIRVMRVPRYSELILPPEFYVDDSDAIVEKIGEAMFEIEKRGFGRAQLETVAHKLALRLF